MDVSGIKKALAVLRAGEPLLVFPEGTRSLDGSLQPGKAGIGMIAHRSRMPILLLYIAGANRVLPRGANFIRFRHVYSVFGKPLCYADLLFQKGSTDIYQEISNRVMEEMEKLRSSFELE